MKKSSGSGTLSSNGTDIGRRTILKSAALVVGAGAAIQSCPSAGNAPSASASYEVAGPSVIARAGTAVVEIESGKIRRRHYQADLLLQGDSLRRNHGRTEPFLSSTKTETMDRNSKLAPLQPRLPPRQRHGTSERRRGLHVPMAGQRRG